MEDKPTRNKNESQWLWKGTATNITETTRTALVEFCTKNFGAPFLSPHASVGACDDKLYNHIRTKFRALTVDSAGNEVAAGENMMSEVSCTAHVPGVEAFAPNMTFIIRDKAHGSRRILSRPWMCDDYLAAVAGSLITDSGSLAQLIQHSDDLRAIYNEASKNSSCQYVSTSFSHMRAAKHRFESMCTPLSRICLDWEACIAFLARVCIERPGDRAGVFAAATLQGLDEEIMLQAALLADASDECMILIRFFDQREVDNAKICTEVKRFIEAISLLFYEERIWVVEGHTKVCLDFLQKQTHFLVNGQLRSVGGPRVITGELRTRVLKRMQAWTVLAKEVVRAEHPEYEVVSSFSCFDLEGWPKQSVDELVKRGRTKQFDGTLIRLANTFAVDEIGLHQEFWDYGSRAAIHHERTGCTNVDAWAWALKASSASAARKRHPASNLEVVLAEYVSISASDSIIEHDFSRVKKMLGEHKLNCKDGAESDLVMVLLNDPQFDVEMAQRAQYVWRELYAASRCTSAGPKRIDKGVKRGACDTVVDVPSEKQWVHIVFEPSSRVDPRV